MMTRRTAMIRMTAAAAALALLPAMAPACDVPDDLAQVSNRVIKLTNKRREKAGLGAVQRNEKLTRAAQKHACWQADNGVMSHTGQGGSTMDARATAEGYVWSYVAENVAMGQQTALEVVKTWMQSPTHRTNMLSAHAREIGIGWAKSGPQTYWVMLLAAPR